VQLEGNPMQDLAQRVRRGDVGAVEEFRREMGLALEGIVRLALRRRACFSPFETTLRLEAARLCEKRHVPRDELARAIGAAVCENIVRRLQNGGRLQDTFARHDAETLLC
jgi:hypothetical protein